MPGTAGRPPPWPLFWLIALGLAADGNEIV